MSLCAGDATVEMLKVNCLFLLLLLTSSCQSLAEEDTLQIGVIQSLTGIAAEDGKTVVQALELAARKINSKHPNKIKLLVEDDQTDPKKTVSAYHRLRSQNVDAIIGATWDFTTNTLLPLVGRDKIVLFNTSTLPESLNLAQASGYAFINSISTYDEALPFKRFLTLNRVKSLVIVYANNSWGEVQQEIYEKIASDLSLAIVEKIASVEFDENEWRELLPRLKTKAPQLILLLLNKNDLEIFLKRLKEIGFNPGIFASKNAYDAVQSTKAINLYEGICFTYPFEQLKAQPKFIRDYTESFNEPPRIYADNTYDALSILDSAYRLSLEKRISLKKALMHIEYSGLVGSYQYSSKASFSVGRSSLVCITNGKVDVRARQL